MLKCCVCGAPVSAEQAKRFAVGMNESRLATCSLNCQELAKSEPGQCHFNSDTALELIPL